MGEMSYILFPYYPYIAEVTYIILLYFYNIIYIIYMNVVILGPWINGDEIQKVFIKNLYWNFYVSYALDSMCVG